ncbi:hypothetical protein TSMEX_001114 [Taenia solium]
MRMKKGAMVDSISSLASLTGVAPNALDGLIYAVPGIVDFDKLGRMTNTCTSKLQLFHVLMDYGMRVFHAGKDFFKLKNPIRSINEVKLPEIKAIPMEESKTNEWKVTTRCFSIDWNIGLKQLTVDAESKLKVFFKTQINLEDVDIKHWKGVHIKGKGTFNKMVGFVVNSGLLTNPIQKEIVKKVRKYMPQKLAALKEKIHFEVNALANRTIERYGVKGSEL